MKEDKIIFGRSVLVVCVIAVMFIGLTSGLYRMVCADAGLSEVLARPMVLLFLLFSSIFWTNRKIGELEKTKETKICFSQATWITDVSFGIKCIFVVGFIFLVLSILFGFFVEFQKIDTVTFLSGNLDKALFFLLYGGILFVLDLLAGEKASIFKENHFIN